MRTDVNDAEKIGKAKWELITNLKGHQETSFYFHRATWDRTMTIRQQQKHPGRTTLLVVVACSSDGVCPEPGGLTLPIQIWVLFNGNLAD